MRAAFDELIAKALRYAPEAQINGVSVQEMIVDGFEMVVGIKNDPTFGPAVVVGAGGIYTELLEDVATRLAPLRPHEAQEMVRSLRYYSILCGARGRQPADLDALYAAIEAVSELGWQLRDRVAELDINPLVVLPEGRGVRALDALVVPFGAAVASQVAHPS